MKKKELRNFFSAVISNDVFQVVSLLSADDRYLWVCNAAPPKKHDGQSGLQVALKTGSFDVARLLIERGADVDFIETSAVNEWNAPVLHDCIRATIFNSCTLQRDLSRFETAVSLLERMLEKNADPNAMDSYGNNCLLRALLDARQMITHPQADLINSPLLSQLRRVFALLIKAGADIKLANDRRPSAASILENFRLEPYRLW